MSKKSEYLSAKDKKAYSRLLTAKLEEMGLRDMITYHPSGKQYRVYELEATPGQQPLRVRLNEAQAANMHAAGTKFTLDKDGKPVFELVDVPQARNILRNMVRNLRNQPRAQINAFLKMSLHKPATPPPAEEIQNG